MPFSLRRPSSRANAASTLSITGAVSASPTSASAIRELPPLIYALYSGNKKEAIQDVGSTSGIAAGRYDASTAYRKADGLMRMRIEADYGPSSSAEPYDRAHIDEWLETANDLVRDLESLL
jgi:hypothetical protein